MITKETKARAIALLKHNYSPLAISEEMDIPIKLLEEWASKLDGNDLTTLESNCYAVEKLALGDITTMKPINPEILRIAVEDTALDITKAMGNVMRNGDVQHAKALELMSTSLVKIYHTIVMKGNAIEEDNGDRASNKCLAVFESMMKD